jgi:hypothetical protein
VAVPVDWPVFPETVEVPERIDGTNTWGTYWGIHAADATLAAEGGVSTPDADGQGEHWHWRKSLGLVLQQA